jgi:hypothetical protein
VSLKGVELQIAIPKTFDAGKIADQHQQNTINQQLHANEALKREIERKQFSVNESEEMDAINEEEDNNQPGDGQSKNRQNKKNKQELEQKAKHPFKGNLFDFSG